MTELGNKGRRLIFIGGCPRSGTTLVQNMLDCHPLVLGGPEFLHLPDMIALRRKLYASIAREWIDIICSEEEVDAYLVNWIERLFFPLASEHHCEFYSEKTPENILVFRDLMELFPEAHFIQVVRDPRAILASMQQVRKRALSKGLKPPSFTAKMSTSLAYIKRCVESGSNACHYAPEKVLTVVYEQLIAEPETEAKKICTHIGIEWDERMLRPGDKTHLGVRAITTKSDEIWYDAKSFSQNIINQDVEKWRKNLSLYQQLCATMAFSDNQALKQSGYVLTVSNLIKGRRFHERIYGYGLFIGRKLFRILLGGVKRFRKRTSTSN